MTRPELLSMGEKSMRITEKSLQPIRWQTPFPLHVTPRQRSGVGGGPCGKEDSVGKAPDEVCGAELTDCPGLFIAL